MNTKLSVYCILYKGTISIEYTISVSSYLVDATNGGYIYVFVRGRETETHRQRERETESVCVCLCIYLAFCPAILTIHNCSASYDLAHAVESIDVLQFNSQIVESVANYNIK